MESKSSDLNLSQMSDEISTASEIEYSDAEI